MAPVNRVARLSPRTAVARRVIRRGHASVCGMCLSSYGDHESAHKCLVACWQVFRRLPPVVPRLKAKVGGHEVTYRCRLCSRDYESAAEAASCAAACLRRSDLDFDDDDLDGVGNHSGPRWRPRQDRFMAVARRRAAATGKIGVAEPSAMPNPVAPPAAPPAAPPVGAGAAPKPPAPTDGGGGDAPEETKLKVFDPNDPFFRDGAFYVCRVCSKRFYTRVEVTSCFNSHAGPDGRVVVPVTDV